MSKVVNMDVSLAQQNSQTGKSSNAKQTTSEPNHESGLKSVCSELEQKLGIVTENVQIGPAEARAAESDCIGIEQLRPIPEESNKNSSCEQLGQPSEDATMNSSLKQFGLLPEDTIGKFSNPKQITLELNHEFGSENICSESLEQGQEIGTENVQNRPAETRMSEFDYIGIKQLEQPPEDATKNNSWGQLKPPPEDVTMESSLGQLGLPPEDSAMNSNLEQLGPPPDNASQNPGLEQLGALLADAAKNPHWSQCGNKRISAKSRKGKYGSRSSVGSTRILRSRSQEKSKAPEPSNILAEHGANEEKKRKKKKKNQIKKIPVNEFSRIRNHLKYLLNRMSYEKNLIDAYSGEGWKGQSLEKVKLEKELERAKSEIFRCKLKIRDLFQRLDLSCAVGRLPKSLFDSEGQIDSEDIFCAKCGSKDLAADNDIILCDGACERGFHQFCLEPPLLKEYIPPDDEGWLCPGCDCKVDCIDLLNESQGTNLSITDSGEKVFPEAAAASGNKLDDSFGFPSDDSQDDDYDPDGPQVDEKVQGDGASSEESDFFSASDDFGASPSNEQYLGLPSDDSEDDDYDPNAPDLDEQAKWESSSSDFTSDSEDFSVAFDDNRSSGRDEGPMSSSSDPLRPSRGSDGEMKKQSLNDEFLSLLESDPGQSDSAQVSGRRHVERLDYKKLHDETYGNVSSDSSDEDWMDTAAPKKRKNNTGEVALVSPNGKTPVVNNGSNAKDMKHNQKESEHTPKRRACKKVDVEGTNISPAKSHKESSEPGSSGKSTKRSACKKLGEAVTQRLFKSFKENQYPERATKENFAKELGITFQQVSKWFENARWSFHHSSRMESNRAESAPDKGASSPQVKNNPPEPESKFFTRDAACNGAENKELPKTSPDVIVYCSGDVRSENLVISRGKSTTPKSRKRKSKLDHQASDHISSIEETPKRVDSPETREVQKSGQSQTRRKSVA